MSDYLTNLAVSLTNPEPAIRPRLGARFEPTRPRIGAGASGAWLPGLAPAAVDGMGTTPEFARPRAVETSIASIAAPASPLPPQAIEEERGAAGSGQTADDGSQTARHLSPEVRNPTAHTPSERVKAARQAPLIERANAAGTLAHQPQETTAALAAAPAARSGSFTSRSAAETAQVTTPDVAQRQDRPAAMADPLALSPASKPAARQTEPIRPLAGMPSQTLVQPEEPPVAQTRRLASPQVSVEPGWPQPAAPAHVEMFPARGRTSPGDQGSAFAGPPPDRLPDLHPAAPATPVAHSVRLAVGAHPPPVAPTIRVTIGRVEVRATPAGQPGVPPIAQSKATARKPVVSLEEYLAQRNGDRR